MKWYLVEDQKEFSEWNRAAIAKATGAQALQGVEPDPAIAQTINGKTLLPLTDDGPTKGPYQVATRTITHDGSTATAGYVVSNMALADRQAKMVGEIAARRYVVETGGIAWTRTSDSKTFLISTDRDSQPKLHAARNSAKDGLRPAGAKWKCAETDGSIIFEAFSDADMQLVAEAALDHVQGAFDREADLYDATLDPDADHAALDLIDIEAGSIDGAGGW